MSSHKPGHFDINDDVHDGQYTRGTFSNEVRNFRVANQSTVWPIGAPRRNPVVPIAVPVVASGSSGSFGSTDSTLTSDLSSDLSESDSESDDSVNSDDSVDSDNSINNSDSDFSSDSDSDSDDDNDNDSGEASNSQTAATRPAYIWDSRASLLESINTVGEFHMLADNLTVCPRRLGYWFLDDAKKTTPDHDQFVMDDYKSSGKETADSQKNNLERLMMWNVELMSCKKFRSDLFSRREEAFRKKYGDCCPEK